MIYCIFWFVMVEILKGDSIKVSMLQTGIRFGSIVVITITIVVVSEVTRA